MPSLRHTHFREEICADYCWKQYGFDAYRVGSEWGRQLFETTPCGRERVPVVERDVECVHLLKCRFSKIVYRIDQTDDEFEFALVFFVPGLDLVCTKMQVRPWKKRVSVYNERVRTCVTEFEGAQQDV